MTIKDVGWGHSRIGRTEHTLSTFGFGFGTEPLPRWAVSSHARKDAMSLQQIKSRWRVAVAIVAGLVGVSVLTPVPSGATAPTLNWISWTAPGSYPLTTGVGSHAHANQALGTITMPGGSTVYVKLEGEVLQSVSAFGVSGSSFWSSIMFSGSGEAFKSDNVPDLPSNSDRIAVMGTGTASQTLSFYSDSARTTPTSVSNIVMPIASLGGGSTQGRWDFDQNFTILSDNKPPLSLWTGMTKTTVSGGWRVSANEGIGTIQFEGSFTAISWTIDNPEYYAMWNIGVTSAPPPSASIVPSTSTINGTAGTPITTVTMKPGAFSGPVTYSIKSGCLPAGLALNTSTGQISGTPTESSSSVIEIEASDGAHTATTSITLNITGPAPSSIDVACASTTTTIDASGTTVDSTTGGGGLGTTGAGALPLLVTAMALITAGLATTRLRRVR